MKTRNVLLFFAVLFLLTTQANAASTRTLLAPSLSFDGTTANCSIFVAGTAPSDEVSATLQLWKGNICIAAWKQESTTYVSIKETATVEKGETYTLTVDISINGVPQATVPVSRTCN